MIYDSSGDLINAVYEADGLPLTEAFDIDGTQVFGESYDIENVVSYYRDDALDVADDINALSSDWISFVIITDSHGTHNKQHSQAIAAYLVRNTKANKLFHLGDVSGNNWSETEYSTYFAPLIENCQKQTHFACGNHEWYGGGVTWDTLQIIYNNFLANKSYLHGTPNHFYYYFDDTAKKIRYLVINTSDGSHNGATQAQMDWIASSVQLPDSTWQLIVFGHMDINPNDPITHSWESSQASAFTNAISGTNGMIIGYFCGHEHHDRIVKVNDTFYQVTLLNDSCAKDSSFSEITNPDRTAGTISEQAVSAISVNTTTGAVVIRRIGAGQNLTYNYLEAPS